MDESLISTKAFATWHLSSPIEAPQWEGWEDGEMSGRLALVSLL